MQVGKHSIAEIFEDKRLAAVADNDPVARTDLHLGHCIAPEYLVSGGSERLLEILWELRQGFFEIIRKHRCFDQVGSDWPDLVAMKNTFSGEIDRFGAFRIGKPSDAI